MGARQICNQRQVFERICIIVEHCANFVQIGNAIVILGAEGNAGTPTASKCHPLKHEEKELVTRRESVSGREVHKTESSKVWMTFQEYFNHVGL